MIAKVIRQPVEYEYVCGNCDNIIDEPKIEKRMTLGRLQLKITNNYCPHCGALLDWRFKDDSD